MLYAASNGITCFFLLIENKLTPHLCSSLCHTIHVLYFVFFSDLPCCQAEERVYVHQVKNLKWKEIIEVMESDFQQEDSAKPSGGSDKGSSASPTLCIGGRKLLTLQ